MHDNIFRHVVTFLITGVLALVFWGGYVAGQNGWAVLVVILLPIYVFLYYLIHA